MRFNIIKYIISFKIFKYKNYKMLSLINKKTINASKVISKKFKYFRQPSKLEYVGDFFNTNETPRNILINNTRRDDTLTNCRVSTFSTERNEIPKKKTKKIAIHENSKNKNKNLNLIKIFKNSHFSKKIIHRPKTTSKKKINKNKFLFTDININNIFKNNNKNIKKRLSNGVPISFMESMRLNTEENLAKADLFFKEEKKRLIKENPILKYQIEYNKRQKIKQEELERINKFKIWKKFFKRNKKEYDINKLNEYHTKLLLKENEQYFDDFKPIIDKSQFYPKYRLLSNNKKEEQKKVFKFTNVRKIFSKYLEDNKFIKKEITKTKYIKEIIKTIKDKDIIYSRFKEIIKKCAIEFKNINIPLDEYAYYVNYSKNIIRYLFNERYIILIKKIKKEEGLDKDKKEKEIINYISNDKLLAYAIDLYGQNILFLSVKHKLYKTLSKIIQFGANINLQDFRGRTVLHIAAKNNDFISVTILLYYLANPSIEDNNGESPLDCAINNGHDSYIIKELLIRTKIIRKLNKYRSWKEYEVYIRRGIQYFLYHNLLREQYMSIFFYIENVNLYYS